MKLSVIGIGQAGCNIADAFHEVNDYASSFFGRRLEILTDAFAINTDEADLSGFKHIPKDKGHRILVGNLSMFGHGVGKINTDAAQIIKSSNLIVADTILASAKFHESDAIMVIASGGGGTGSGMIGWVIKSLKERINKPVYAIIALPFAFETQGDTSFAAINTATCINTVRKYADAIFLVDNERFRIAGTDLVKTYYEMNKKIAGSFYDFGCAGEERSQRFIGGKVIDAGDIRQSLNGFTNTGKGQVNLPVIRLRRNDFHDGIRGQSAVFSALALAESNLSLGIELANARKLLVLVSAPREVITVNAIEDITTYLQKKCPSSVIRIGDYPRRFREVVVSIIASDLVKVPGLEKLLTQAETLLQKREIIEKDNQLMRDRLNTFGASLPTLD